MTIEGAAIGHVLERVIEWCGDEPMHETRCSCGWSSPQSFERRDALLAHEDHVVELRVAIGDTEARRGR